MESVSDALAQSFVSTLKTKKKNQHKENEMVDRVIDSDGVSWVVVKVWDDGDVTLMDTSGYKIDVSVECFEHYYRRENEE